MNAEELVIGMQVRYPRTGTSGRVTRVEQQHGDLFAELDSTGLLYQIGELVPAASTKGKEEQKKETQEQYKELLEFIKGQLDDNVKEVRFSSRLTESACCLVADEYGMNANMERIMKAMNQDVPKSKRILELNPAHPIMQTLGTMFAADKDNPKLADYCELLLDQALLTEGSPIKDPLRFTKLVSELMVKAG